MNVYRNNTIFKESEIVEDEEMRRPDIVIKRHDHKMPWYSLRNRPVTVRKQRLPKEDSQWKM